MTAKMIKPGGLSLVLDLLIFCKSPAQVYQIGSASYALSDPARPGRVVQVKLYYPATANGNNAPWAAGTFPVVSFGHGFSMFYTAYQNIWEYFVPRGYVMAMLDMENSVIPPPSHSNFGLDIRFAAKELIQRSTTATSDPIYGKLNGKAAFMGHSMGGGSSVLGAAAEPGFPDAVVGLSAAETNPSAVAAAAQVTSPFLMLAGEKDLVTPPSQHQIPIFNALASSCKIYAEIKGGVHCYYAQPDLACDFGETTSGSQPGITRAQQQQATYDIVLPFLDWHLKGASGTPFFTVLSDPRYTVVNNCATVSTGSSDNPNSEAFAIIPYPDGCKIAVWKEGFLQVNDLIGRSLLARSIKAGEVVVIPAVQRSIWVVQLEANGVRYTARCLSGLAP